MIAPYNFQGILSSPSNLALPIALSYVQAGEGNRNAQALEYFFHGGGQGGGEERKLNGVEIHLPWSGAPSCSRERHGL